MADRPQDIALIQRYVDTAPPHMKIDIAILGAGAVGKRCVRTMIVQKYFPEVYDPTLEDCSSTEVDILGRKIMTSWDDVHTDSYEPEYSAQRWKYGLSVFNKVDGVLLMCTCTQARTFEHIKSLYEAWLKQRGDSKKAEHKKVFLVVGKYEFAESQYCDPKTIVQAELFCLRYGLTLLRVSPRTGFGLEPADIQDIVKHIILGKVKGEGLSQVSDKPQDLAHVQRYLVKSSRPCVSIAILGSDSVGKRCARIRIVQGNYSEKEPFDPTLLEDNRRSMNILGRMVDTEWLAIPEIHSSTDPWWMSLHTMEHADACILMFDSCRQISFQHLKALYYAGENKSSWQYKKVFIAMSKVDLLVGLYDTKLVEDAEHFCESNGLPLLRVSAKSGRGFGEEEIQNIVLHILLEKLESQPSPKEVTTNGQSRCGLVLRMKNALRSAWSERRALRS